VGRLAVRERQADMWAMGVSDRERGMPLMGGPTRHVGPRCKCCSSTDRWAPGI
jgi:hypothetical protein